MKINKNAIVMATAASLVLFLFCTLVYFYMDKMEKDEKIALKVEKSKADLIFLSDLHCIGTIEFGQMIVPSFFYEDCPHVLNEQRQISAILQCNYFNIKKPVSTTRIGQRFDHFDVWAKQIINSGIFKTRCDGLINAIDRFSDEGLPYRFYWASILDNPNPRGHDALMVGNGPDKKPDIDPLDARFYGEISFVNKIYDPTNGVSSQGDIVIHYEQLSDLIKNPEHEQELARTFVESFCSESPE